LVKQGFSSELKKAAGRLLFFDGIPPFGGAIGMLFQLLKETNSASALFCSERGFADGVESHHRRRICVKCGSVYKTFLVKLQSRRAYVIAAVEHLVQSEDDRLEVVQCSIANL